MEHHKNIHATVCILDSSYFFCCNYYSRVVISGFKSGLRNMEAKVRTKIELSVLQTSVVLTCAAGNE